MRETGYRQASASSSSSADRYCGRRFDGHFAIPCCFSFPLAGTRRSPHDVKF
jgi:hypothetical protein